MNKLLQIHPAQKEPLMTLFFVVDVFVCLLFLFFFLLLLFVFVVCFVCCCLF